MSACPACRGIPCRCFDRSNPPPAGEDRYVVLQPGEKFFPPAKRCDNCDHWAAGSPIYDGDKIIGHMGDCRRRAPVVRINRFDNATTHWPQTQDEIRCGDWEPARS